MQFVTVTIYGVAQDIGTLHCEAAEDVALISLRFETMQTWSRMCQSRRLA